MKMKHEHRGTKRGQYYCTVRTCTIILIQGMFHAEGVTHPKQPQITKCEGRTKVSPDHATQSSGEEHRVEVNRGSLGAP